MFTRKRHGIITMFLLVISIILCICIWLAALAGYIHPKSNVYIAFFGLAYVYLLFAMATMFIIWLLRGRLLYALAIAAAVALTWPRLKNSYAYHPGGEDYTAAAAPGRLRLVTYNVHLFSNYDNPADTLARRQMVNVIADEKPDVACLQEFSTNLRGRGNMIALLKETLGMAYVYFVPVTQNDYQASGTAIFSRYPLVNTGTLQLGNSGGTQALYADVQLNNRLARIFCVHLQSNLLGKEAYAFLDSLRASGSSTPVGPGLRIGLSLKNAFIKRSTQADLLRAQLVKCTKPFIIAGDFNDTPASYAATTILSGLNNAFSLKGSGFGSTYNGKFPNFQIDYIAASTTFSVHSYKILQYKLSDHYAVRADLSLH